MDPTALLLTAAIEVALVVAHILSTRFARSTRRLVRMNLQAGL